MSVTSPLALARRRHGFTLVELLVVIAIIGVLVALLLPAVQAAREAARRSQCSNNLRQMGLALHNYHDTQMAFPINYRPKGTTGAADYATWSWMQGILPYIEQANLYNTLSVSERMSLPNNLQVANTPVKTYLCPSDGLTRGGMMGGRSDSGGTKAVQNYKACSGAAWNWAFVNTNNMRWGPTESNGLTKCDGLMCSNSQGTPPSDMSWVSKNMTRIATVSDGTSNTFAIGEAIPAWSNWTWWYCQNAAVASCGLPLNYQRGITKLETNAANWNNNYGFYSLHPSGANFGMCDASVRFVPDNISLTSYRALATTEGGETVTE